MSLYRNPADSKIYAECYECYNQKVVADFNGFITLVAFKPDDFRWYCNECVTLGHRCSEVVRGQAMWEKVWEELG